MPPSSLIPSKSKNKGLIPAGLLLVLLAIEFLDEFVYGGGEAAWPFIRDDLLLTYVEIGLLMSIPRLFSNLVEPAIGILADVWKRRLLVLAGGLLFAFSLLLTSFSSSFPVLLVSFCLFGPASGAFVNLSQATLMDADPDRHEHNMARWTFAGSLGVILGPLALGAAAILGAGWRGLYLGYALLAAILLLAAYRIPFDRFAFSQANSQEGAPGFIEGLRLALDALRQKEILRWLALLEFSDLMLDVLLGFLALYFVDVAGLSPQQAGLAVAVWTGMGLIGDLLLIPLLEHVSGLGYLRVSALLELILFSAFLLAEPSVLKIILVGLLGFFNSGWYAILRARLYSAMPGKSGSSIAVSNFAGLVGSLLPLGLGWIAERYNLQVSMWLLLAGPVALLAGLPRQTPGNKRTHNDHNRV